MYLKAIAKIKPLGREEELALARKARAGDGRARETLVRSNLRFVVAVARRYRYSNSSLMDLIHEGNLALIQAIDKFDPEMGCHLLSYAVWSIRQSIAHAVQRNASSVPLPRHQADKLQKILKVKESLEREGKGDANISLLARILKIKPKRVESLLRLHRSSLSLDAVDASEGAASKVENLIDQNSLSPEEILSHAEMKHQLNECLRKLSQQEQEVLKMRYGLGRASFSLEKIGKSIGLSRERIRQIEIKAIAKLRTSKEGKKLAALLAE